MSAELQIAYRSGAALSCVVFPVNSGGLAWRSQIPPAQFIPFQSGVLGDFAFPQLGMTYRGASYYIADMPQDIPPGVYNVVAYDLGLGTGSDNPGQGRGQIQWAGSSGSRFVVPYTMMATSGLFANAFPTQLARSTMVRNFPIYLKSPEDHVTPFTSGIVSGQIARDSGLFTALQSGEITETGNGFYNVMALTSGDLDAGTAKMLFVARGVSGGWSDPLAYSLVLQRNANSGS